MGKLLSKPNVSSLMNSLATLNSLSLFSGQGQNSPSSLFERGFRVGNEKIQYTHWMPRINASARAWRPKSRRPRLTKNFRRTEPQNEGCDFQNEHRSGSAGWHTRARALQTRVRHPARYPFGFLMNTTNPFSRGPLRTWLLVLALVLSAGGVVCSGGGAAGEDRHAHRRAGDTGGRED